MGLVMLWAAAVGLQTFLYTTYGGAIILANLVFCAAMFVAAVAVEMRA